jgi:hypothetical protein
MRESLSSREVSETTEAIIEKVNVSDVAVYAE